VAEDVIGAAPMIFTAEAVVPSCWTGTEDLRIVIKLGGHEVARFEPQGRIYSQDDADRCYLEEELAGWIGRLLELARGK
jgi:hypothetical protein